MKGNNGLGHGGCFGDQEKEDIENRNGRIAAVGEGTDSTMTPRVGVLL